ncbi:MAG: 23S rRNA (guanosine(2251)-2'-O)-methyltransferase RlmB, partial [Clostridia bacterium]|nr:23S rRNA (guanosine(2251)-2'-O)-methyltransferase RlmB [Clostridia bacterium]
MINENDKNEELIYGRNPVSEALKAGRAINKVLIAEGETHGALKPIEAMCAERGLLVKYVSRREIDRAIQELTGERNTNHQGVAAYIAAAPYVEPEDILAAAREKGE